MTILDIKRRQEEVLRCNDQRLADHRSGRLPGPVVESGEDDGVFWTRVRNDRYLAACEHDESRTSCR